VRPEESSHPLATDLGTRRGLAQVAHDDTKAADPRGIEP
jgi:hypothetical protein